LVCIGKEIHYKKYGNNSGYHTEHGDHGEAHDGGGLLALCVAVQVLTHVA
jgi:hypothetical protein